MVKNTSNNIPIDQLKKDLLDISTKEKVVTSAWFFKTKIGEYGYGDIFIGATVPEQRLIAKKYKNLTKNELQKLLQSKEHEFRLTALLIFNYSI